MPYMARFTVVDGLRVPNKNYINLGGTAVTKEGVKQATARIAANKVRSEEISHMSKSQLKKLGLLPKKPKQQQK